MSSAFSFAAAIFSLASGVIASAGTRGSDALYRACDQTYTKFTFECPKKYKKTACSCHSPEYLASWMYCVSVSGTPQSERERAYHTLMSVCAKTGKRDDLTVDDLNAYFTNATEGDYFINVKDVVNKTATVYSPLKAKKETILISIHSFRAHFYDKYVGKLYGGIILSYWAMVLTVGALINFLKWVAPGLVNKCNNKFWLLIRQKVATPAAYGYKHSTPLKKWYFINMAIPTRAQSLVLVGYGVIHFILLFLKYDLFKENNRFTTMSMQLSRYLADRCGIFACFHLPLLFLLAGRNNMMLWLTGWSFETMNVYHRWVARGMYFNAIIHSAGYTRFEVLKDDYPSIFKEDTYVAWGLVATVAGGVVAIFSHRFFREKFHETFLLVHWTFVSLFLAGCWWHLQTQGYMQWVWCAVAVWAFDRFLRAVRILYSGINAKAQVQLYPHNVMKFKIDYSNWYNIPSGAHAYIHMFPLFWQSHPFSIYRSPVPGEEKKMVLAIRKRGGISKTLAHKLSNIPDGQQSMHVLIDGPYFQRFHLANYQTVVFVAGGIGVTATFGYIDSLKRAERSEKQQLVFIWVVRNRVELEWFKEELDYLHADSGIEIRIFITNQGEIDPHTISSSDAEGDSQEKEVEKGSDSDRVRAVEYNAIYTKPDLHELISSYVTESDGSIAFLACGPPSMNDDARASVTENLSRSKGRIEYFEESFAW